MRLPSPLGDHRPTTCTRGRGTNDHNACNKHATNQAHKQTPLGGSAMFGGKGWRHCGPLLPRMNHFRPAASGAGGAGRRNRKSLRYSVAGATTVPRTGKCRRNTGPRPGLGSARRPHHPSGAAHLDTWARRAEAWPKHGRSRPEAPASVSGSHSLREGRGCRPGACVKPGSGYATTLSAKSIGVPTSYPPCASAFPPQPLEGSRTFHYGSPTGLARQARGLGGLKG